MLKSFFFQVFFVSSLTYLTGILTMIGSTVLVTAAMTTLGPIVRHSPTRLTPLPITNVLPITEQTTEENVIEEEPLPHVDKQPSLSTKSIDYMLAELMTVVSLPTTFVKFWYSTLDQLNSGILPSKTNNNNVEPTLMCSNGPCLQTANPNCHNITNSQVWESWDICTECQNCQEDKQQQKLRFGNQDGSVFQSGIFNVNNQCQKQTFDWAVRCCCKHGTDPDYTDTVVRNTYADVLVGFNTGFLSPVYVTT